ARRRPRRCRHDASGLGKARAGTVIAATPVMDVMNEKREGGEGTRVHSLESLATRVNAQHQHARSSLVDRSPPVFSGSLELGPYGTCALVGCTASRRARAPRLAGSRQTGVRGDPRPRARATLSPAVVGDRTERARDVARANG